MDTLDTIRDFCVSTKDTFEKLGKGLHYLSHPKELLVVVWDGVSDVSFFATMIICMAAIILYIGGYEKGKKIALGSFYTYIVILMIKAGG